MLIKLGCCISYTDKSKTKTLNSKSGQTALYWIIMNTPHRVIYLYLNNIRHHSYLTSYLIKAEDALDKLHEKNTYQTKHKYYLAALEANPDERNTEFVPESAVSIKKSKKHLFI